MQPNKQCQPNSSAETHETNTADIDTLHCRNRREDDVGTERKVQHQNEFHCAQQTDAFATDLPDTDEDEQPTGAITKPKTEILRDIKSIIEKLS